MQTARLRQAGFSFLSEQYLLKEEAIIFDTYNDLLQNPFICIEAFTIPWVNLNSVIFCLLPAYSFS